MLAVALGVLVAGAAAGQVPLQSAEDQRLIMFGADESSAKWMSQRELDAWVHENMLRWVSWMDITDHPTPVKVQQVAETPFPETAVQQAVVAPAIAQLNVSNINETVAVMQDFLNRFWDTQTGVDGAYYVMERAQSIVDTTGIDATVELYPHSWLQPSVIVTWAGESDDELVLVSSHIDSTVVFGDRAPGADDDASGVAIALEALRALASTGFKPKRTIQVVFSAAEEVGLRGSQDLAADYASQGIGVFAVLNAEMCGYPTPGNPHVALIDDALTDKPFVDYLIMLIDEYLAIGYELDTCGGGGCADHASWSRNGYRSTTQAEAGPSNPFLNPNYHRATDLLEFLDIEYMNEFAKLAVAFMVELSLA